jgi:hypothetical protein
MTPDDERKARALARSARFRPVDDDASSQTGSERVALCTALSRWAHGLSGQPFPRYDRATMPVRRTTTQAR